MTVDYLTNAQAANNGDMQQEVQEEIGQATLGYALWDTLTPDHGGVGPRLQAGLRNPRSVNERQVKDLLNSFGQYGLFSRSPPNELLIGVDPAWLDTSSLSSQFRSEALRPLVWNAGAESQVAVLYNGQHRIAAACQRVQPLMSRKKKHLSELEKNVGLIDDDELAHVKVLIADIDKTVNEYRYWAVRLFDIS